MPMRVDREELTTKYGSVFFKFDFSAPLKFRYGEADYDLTDKAGLIDLVSRAARKRDYEICKIANNILAVLEVESGAETYLHTPVILHIELSSFCDCECIMCKHCYERNLRASFLPGERFDEIETYFPACRIAIINGYGEPFIHPRISGIITLFESYKVKLFTTTNLQHLPSSSAAQLGRVFGRINVSCDGACADTYESIRRGASFERFQSNVKLLRETCPEVPLFMSVVAMRQNVEESVELVRLAKRLGFEEIRFGRLGSNVFLENERDELIYYPNIAGLMMERAREEGQRLGIRVVTPIITRGGAIDRDRAEAELKAIHSVPFFKGEAHYRALHEKFRELAGTHAFEPHRYSIAGTIPCRGMCHWIGYGLYINSSGNVRPCSEVPYNREQEGRSETINYNHDELTGFRRVFLSGQVPGVCMDCAFIMSDEIGCLKVDLAAYKRFFGEKAEVGE